MSSEKLSHFSLSLVLLVFLISGLGGVDFGIHWDESTITGGISYSVVNKTILPQSYYYSSVPHDIGLISLFPDIASYWAGNRFSLSGLTNHLSTLTLSESFLIRMRALTILSTSLSCLWIDLGVLAWRRSHFEAFLAAALIGLSWEVGYHSRWFSPDPYLMQFAALSLACVLAANQKNTSHFYVMGAAVAAGLGLGAKYPGGLLFLLPAAALWSHKKSPATWLMPLGLFIGTFLITTPGFVVEFSKAINQIFFNASHYYSMEHTGYNVGRGLEHASLMFVYLGGALFSKYPPIAILFSLFCLAGIYSVIKDKNNPWVLFIFPALYVFYFSMQVVMIVRNLLVLAPFLAVLSARGVTWAESFLGKKRNVYFFRAVLISCLAVNATWLVHAMNTIRHREDRDQVLELARYIESRPTKKFLIPASLGGAIQESNATSNPTEKTDYAVFSTYQAKGRFDGRWPANRYGFATTWFGSYEVNLNYYPSWWGNHRLVVMPTERAMKVLLPVPTDSAQTERGLKKYFFPGY